MAKVGALVQAIEILRKYKPDIDDRYLNAEHDQIWLPCNWEEVTNFEDQKKLEELGFFEDEEAVSAFA